MRLILATVLAASVTPALAADLSASDVRSLLGSAGVNPGTSREIDGERRTITSVHVLRGLRRGDFVIRIHIEEGHGRQAEQ
jgi:hypothetical protein